MFRPPTVILKEVHQLRAETETLSDPPTWPLGDSTNCLVERFPLEFWDQEKCYEDIQDIDCREKGNRRVK